MNVENAYTVPLAERAREVVDVPIIVAGRINEPQQAERVLAAGIRRCVRDDPRADQRP